MGESEGEGERILQAMNRDMDDVGPVGGEMALRLLQDMNDLEAWHDEFVESLAPRVDVL